MNALVPVGNPATTLPSICDADTCLAAASIVPGHWVRPRLSQIRSLDHAAGQIAAAGGTVCNIWNAQDHRIVRRFVASEPIGSIALAKDASRIALADGSTVRVFRLDSGDIACEYAHAAPVTSVYIAWEAPLVASADINGEIQVRSLQTGALLTRALHLPGNLKLFVDQRNRFVVSESDCDVRFLDLKSGGVLRQFSHGAKPESPAPRFCIGQMLIAFSGNHVRLFDCGSSDYASSCFRVIEFGSRIVSVDVADDQSVFLVATSSGQINFYDMQDARLLARQQAFSRPLFAAKFERGRRVLAAAGEGLVMAIEEGHHVQSYYETPPIITAALDPERRSLLVADRVGGVTAYDVTNGRRSDRFAGHAATVSVVVCDTRFVATGSYDGKCSVRAWNGTAVADFDLNLVPIQALALDSHAARIWVGDFSGSVTCFDLETRLPIAAYREHANSIRSLCLASDGALLASGDDDGRLVVRDLRMNGAVLWRTRLEGSLYRVIFDVDASLLASSLTGVMRFAIGKVQPVAVYGGTHIRWFTLLDNGQLCALGLEGDLRIFDVDSRACVRHVRLDDARRHRVVLALGPDRIVTGSADGTLRFFDYKLENLGDLHHLPHGVLWMTRPQGTHPGWFFTDRPELLEIGVTRNGERNLWPPNDARRATHLTVFNSAAHVLQMLNGTPATRRGSSAVRHHVSRFEPGARQLGYEAPGTESGSGGVRA